MNIAKDFISGMVSGLLWLGIICGISVIGLGILIYEFITWVL